MIKKKFIHIARGFKEAEEFDRNYYAQMTPEERLNIVQELREIFPEFSQNNRKGSKKHAHRKRLQRVVKIV